METQITLNWKKIENPQNAGGYNTLSFTRKPKPFFKYIRILKYISLHPGSTKEEVMLTTHGTRFGKELQGYCSTMWRSLTGANFLEKYRDGRKVCYFITELGEEKLNEAYKEEKPYYLSKHLTYLNK